MRRRLGTPWLLWLALLLAGGGALLTVAQQPPPPPPREEKQGPLQTKPPPEEQAPYALKVEVPIVNVDLTVADRRGNLVTGLQRENFRIYQDGVEQDIVAFAPSEAPLTSVLVVETNPGLGYLLWDNLDAAYFFLRQLRKGDWAALVSYDLKPHVVVDFTQNPNDIREGLRRLTFPAGFREAQMFDAVVDTLDRVSEVEGKKSLIVIGTGLNTFGGRYSWDDMRRIAREHRTTIFCIGMGWTLQMYYERAEARGYRVQLQMMDLRVAENQMRVLSEMTGGQAYFPRFITEMPNIYQEIGALLRNQYSLAFRPKDFKRDGKFHKIEIKLVGADGQPLKVFDQKGKSVKYEIYAREGYYAPEA